MKNRMSKESSKQYRVFMGMTEIAGYFTRLSDSFQELGIENYFVDIGFSSDNYEKKYKRFDNGTTRRLRNAYAGFNSEINPAGRVLSLFRFGFHMTVLFLWALIHADVFLFVYGNTFFSRVPLLRSIDLKLMRLFRKIIIFVYVGSDSRPLYASFAVNFKNEDEIAALTSKQQKAIRMAEKYASYVLDNPASAHFHGKKYINFFRVGMPIDDFTGNPSETRDDSEAVVILHAPSKPELKGTDRIRDTVERLKQKGYPINYVELTGVPNRIIRENITQCDFIIDELYSDCLLAGFSTEAAQAGKPAVIGGYAGDFLRSVFGSEELPPSIYADPDQLEQAVESLISDRDKIREIGAKAKVYVSENWNSNAIAEKYIRIFRGDVPEDWYYDPYDCEYIFGCGAKKENIKKAVAQIIEKYGITALCIDDKPKLIKEYKKLIKR